MAEAVLDKEIDVSQPKAESQVSEPAEETTPAPVPEVEDDNLKDVLSELGLGDVATSEGTDATPKSNESEADPYAGLSPQEIAKKVREEVDAENTAKTSSRDYQNYVQGVNRSFNETYNDLDKLADTSMWDADTRKTVKDKFASFKGHYDVLFQYATEQNNTALREGMKKALIDAATAAGVKDVSFASAPDFIAKLTEHAKTGSISEAEAKKREGAAAEKGIKAYRERLIKAGVEIPGVRVPEVPNNPGIPNARAGTSAWAATADINEINEALKKAGV